MRKTEVLGRVVLVSSGFLAAIVLLEGGLQLGAVAVKLTGGGAPAAWLTGGQRILCLGDSNTYGVHLEHREEQAWPFRLEALWNEAGRSPRIEVLNVGYPGTNSSRLLRDFPEMLDVFEPDLVLVMVGVNDHWTAEVSADAANELHGAVAFLRRHSRVFRLWQLLSRRFDRAELEVRVEVGVSEGDDLPAGGRGVARFGSHELPLGWSTEVTEGRRWRKGWRGALWQNLRTLAVEAQERGVRLVLLSYPARRSVYGKANEVIRRAAEETGTPLVDLERIFIPLCPDEECLEWFLRDRHPNAAGHQQVASALIEALALPTEP